jgi:hypothetical protein
VIVFYHMTSRGHLAAIIEAGMIMTTESNVGSPINLAGWQPFGSHYAPDVVWLMDTTDLNGLDHGLGGSVYDKTEVYISVDVPAFHWLDWAPMQQINPRWKEVIIKRGGGPEAAAHWYVWPGPIKAKHWVEIAEAEET